ncbi:MAG: DegV family protein [Anaerolineae bacterium]|jgi:DegV family protein with EDD domain
MMVRVVTESTADIPLEIAAELGITIVPSYVIFGSETYRDQVELTKAQFYEKLETSTFIPTTATPPPAVYEETYRRLSRETDEIVSIHLAANLSGLHSAAAVAAKNVTEARIAVIDSEQVTMGYGWMAIAAAEAARRGETLEQIVSLVEDTRDRSRLLAVLDTLEFVYRGGRVGWVQAMLGTFLRIKPLVEVRRGEVTLVERARTRARSMDRLFALIQSLGPLERAIVLHTNAPDRAERLATRLQAIMPDWKPLIGQAGVTIASHAGPGAVGVACVTAK